MPSKLDMLLVLGVGAVGVIVYYIAFFAAWAREGRPAMLWLHVLNQWLFGGFLGGVVVLIRQILKG